MSNQELFTLFRAIDNFEPYDDEYDDAMTSEINDMSEYLTVKHLTDLIKYNLKEAFISVDVVMLLDKAIEQIFEDTAKKIIQEKIDEHFIEKYEENQRLKIGSYI